MSLRRKKSAKRRNHYGTSGVTAFLVGIVIFFTFAILILPAIALSTKRTTMDCPVSVHEHTKECYSTDENGQEVLVCGMADYIVHTHDDNCYDEEGNLICTLPEIREHTHDESCYEEQQVLVCDLEENEDHKHTDKCYKTEKVLVCGENELHTHDDSCYDKKGNLICGMLELKAHQHDESCLNTEESESEDPAEETEYDPVASAAEDQLVTADQHADNDILIFEESTETVTVHVEADKDAFPDGTTMLVTDVDDEETTRTITDAVEGQIKGIRAVDITFADAEGKEIEPSGPVRVSMTSKLKKEEKKADLKVVHVDDKGEASELADIEVEAAKKEATASFEADQFSVYAVVYTVDFEYENESKTGCFSMQGGTCVTLYDVIEVLNILDGTKYTSVSTFIADVDTVNFSDESLVKVVCPDEDTTVGKLVRKLGVEKQLSAMLGKEEEQAVEAEIIHKDEWALISIKPFDTEETLTITLKDGTEYSIKVTDEQHVIDNIAELLTDVKIDATVGPDGKYIVYEDQPYSVHLTFREDPNGGQLNMTSGFSYPLPDGLFDVVAPNGTLMIKLSGGTQAGKEVPLNFRVEDGQLKFTWPDQTSDAYNQLKDALYTGFTVDIEAEFKNTKETIQFNDTVIKELDVKNEGNATVTKHGTYNPKTNCVDYTVYVTSHGICTNVAVNDVISGTALTYNGDAVASSSVYGKTVPTPTTNGNGFNLTIPHMGDNEVVTIQYSAAVNLGETTESGGIIGTDTQTKNKVTVTPENHPGDDDELTGKDFNNKISYSTITKSGKAGETDEETGHATVTWTIKANEYANVSMAGHTISDAIDAGSRDIMKYSGSGITVVRKDANGSVVSTEMIPWISLTSHSDEAWSWTVPNTNPDTQNLSYEITYTTDVDMSGKLFNTQVTNNASSDNGGTTGGGANVTPPGGALTARKTVISRDLTNKIITWEVNFDVPAGGLNSAQIVDTLPTYWDGSQVKYIDEYIENSVQVIPALEPGESYEVSTSSDSNGRHFVTIDFHKMVNGEVVDGLLGTGSKRKIRVQFQTDINEDWIEESNDNPNNESLKTHKNEANVILNGQTLHTQASTRIEMKEPGISKIGNPVSNGPYINGIGQMPLFEYTILLTGLSEDSFDENGQIILEDTYNGKYLTYYPASMYQTQDHSYTNMGHLYGSTVTVVNHGDTVLGPNVIDEVGSQDGKLRFVINYSDISVANGLLNEDGSYKPYYFIHYYLAVKDPISLEKLIANAAQSDQGTVELHNTVVNEYFGETTNEIDYQVPVIDKIVGNAQFINGNYVAHYKIQVNKDALQLGDDDELILTDEYENLSIDYTTIKIYDGGTTTEASDVSWDRKGHTMTYYLKNAHYYTIEYDAKITGEPDEHNNVTYTNTAEVFGVKDDETHTQTFTTGGAGDSSTYGMSVFKHRKGAASTPLNATFDLYEYEPTRDQADGYLTRPADNEGVEKDGWKKVGTLTTGADGIAHTVEMTSGYSMHSQTWYALWETNAPAGYEAKTHSYFFWITQGTKPDYNNNVYVNDDVVAINNSPTIPEKVNVTVKKVWDEGEGGEPIDHEPVRVYLYADGDPILRHTGDDGQPDIIRDDMMVELGNDNEWTYTWENLPGGPVYSVVEENVPGYTTTYSPRNTLGLNGENTLTVKNKKIPNKTYVKVEKEWGPGTEKPEDITIHLKRKISSNAEVRVVNTNGIIIEHFPVPVGSKVKITFAGNGFPSYGNPIDYELYDGAYSVGKEPIEKNQLSGWQQLKEVELNATVGEDGLTLRFPNVYGNSYGEWTFANDHYPLVTVTEEASSIPTEDDVFFNGEEHLYTLNADNNWSITIDRLPLSDDDGSYAYYIDEIGVNDNTETPEDAGYEVSYTNNDGITKGTIKVRNDKKSLGKIQVTKAFSGVTALPDGFKITNNYNKDVFTVSNRTGGDGTEASPYTWLIDDIPAGTEVEFTETGVSVNNYTLTITANGTAAPEGSVSASASGTAAKIAAGEQIPTVSFVNEYVENMPQTGSLKITKVVHVNDAAPATNPQKQLVNGNYIFTVSNGNSIVKYVQITVDNGAPVSYKIADSQAGLESAETVTDATAVVSGLEEGDYVITEVGKNGMTLKAAARGDGNTGSVSADKTVTVHVTAGQADPAGNSAAAATFTNNIETVTARVVKVWDHTGNSGTRPTSLMVTLSNGETKELNASNNWTAEVTDLPKYDRTTGNLIEYSWTEADLPAGYYLSNIQESSDATTGVITTTMTNSYTDQYNPTTTITGKKVWDDGGEGRPDSITVKLLKDGVVYESKTVQAPISEGANKDQWPFEFTNLPVFNPDGSVIQYTIEEVLPEGYTDEYGIKIEFSQATYVAGTASYTIVNPYIEDQEIATGTDLGFVVIRHGNDFVVWTPRPLQSGELDIIKTTVKNASEQFNKIMDPTRTIIPVSGLPKTVDVGNKHAVSVYMKNGGVWVKFLAPSAQSDMVYGKIPYTYTQAGGQGGGTITNTKKNTDFEFGKKWIDISQKEIDWDRDIQVTVSRNKADGNKDASFSLVYDIPKESVNSAANGTAEFSPNGGAATDPKLKLTIITEGRTKKYNFKIEKLAYSSETDGKYTYYVEETNEGLEGYFDPTYQNDSAQTNATAAYDGGTIINKQQGGYELPSTGGPGTKIFTILGSILILGVGVLLWRRRRLV